MPLYLFFSCQRPFVPLCAGIFIFIILDKFKYLSVSTVIVIFYYLTYCCKHISRIVEIALLSCMFSSVKREE